MRVVAFETRFETRDVLALARAFRQSRSQDPFSSTEPRVKEKSLGISLADQCARNRRALCDNCDIEEFKATKTFDAKILSKYFI